MAERILKTRSTGHRHGQHVINACQSVDLETGRLLERLGQSVLIRTDDAQDGMAAFREKRRAQFLWEVSRLDDQRRLSRPPSTKREHRAPGEE